MIRTWLYHISPCILAAVISTIAVIIAFVELNHTGGWSFLLLIFLVPALFILLGVDWLIKTITKGNLLYIWISEIILIAIALFWFPDIRMPI